MYARYPDQELHTTIAEIKRLEQSMHELTEDSKRYTKMQEKMTTKPSWSAFDPRRRTMETKYEMQTIAQQIEHLREKQQYLEQELDFMDDEFKLKRYDMEAQILEQAKYLHPHMKVLDRPDSTDCMEKITLFTKIAKSKLEIVKDLFSLMKSDKDDTVSDDDATVYVTKLLSTIEELKEHQKVIIADARSKQPDIGAFCDLVVQYQALKRKPFCAYGFGAMHYVIRYCEELLKSGSFELAFSKGSWIHHCS
jgi:DNA repair exonuclease SbcCD ATPase subunit